MNLPLLPTDTSNFKGQTDTEQVMDMVGLVEFSDYYLGESEADAALKVKLRRACIANGIPVKPSSISGVGTPLSQVFRHLDKATQVQVVVVLAVNHYGLFGVKPVE